ncbi:MAG TPA: Rne/Rng family ribonuclease [Chitinophagaceae bacterium]|nr:Rne/Rng family ribonuclease [Chitinophagaceae bacterium]HMZ45476.1 Rne/Rng family ribonuclease [Chitinophagaceae bacterium]HNJ58351.1 Rne/Rng family ribonuclease [Chitinophagaceae bacterium]HNM35099.1 Rne/Rng family ribonuclease [Chitinophagaceae bacterium]HNN30754.1 Rne/Rng family ribonuclease [Chitinophagaceae bacterium]
MNKELIINTTPIGVEIALLEDKKLVELHNEKSDANFGVGDLYLGKVKKLIPGLNAAFVDVGFEKDAFLHYTDLSPFARSILKFTQQAMAANENSFEFSNFQIEPEIIKSGKINEVLNGKPNVLVQILKEPIAAKGPRLSCEISLPGRFIVLTPFNEIVAVSKKIHSGEERKRLQKIVESIRPKNFGVIVRTAAEGKSTAELHQDLLELTETWKTIQNNIKGAVAPAKILSEQNKTTSILRDLLNESFNKIVVNDKNIFNDIKSYIQRIAPDKTDIVNYVNNGTPLFDQFGITKQVKGAFGKTVNLDSGAYLIIEHTEALHVIDVNSGYKSVSNSQEENALQTNLEAAEEIARQLRLRDIGGIIVVDFIDLKLPDNRKKLQEAMEEYLKADRAKHAVLPISKFGLMQITRQRMRPEVNINTSENCPTCSGTGKVSSTLLLEDEIEKRIHYLSTHSHNYLNLFVHPIVHSHLTKGIFTSIVKKWRRKHKLKLTVKPNTSYGLVEFKFFDKNEEEIKF